MNLKLKIILLCSLFAGAASVGAQVFDRLYHQQFDYAAENNGNNFTNTNFPGEGWTSSTGVITYQHNAGLTYPGLKPAATGGAMVYDFDGSAGGRSALQTDAFLDYGDFSAGQVFEFSALMNVERADFTNAHIAFNAGGAVNRVEFGVTASNMYVTAWMNGGTNTATGPALSIGETNAFLMRVTQGTSTSPTNSLVEIWFNPDYSNLGAADFASTSDTRIGRSGASNAYTGVTYGGNAIGDARVIWDEVQVVAIPEPGTLVLVGIALGSLVLFRRRR
ncbi:MAG: PEP-CTERM sorting domain-containing protein [Verrucomicrobia bacterium]|nr:PEP-CTERM sorting domain-containing protein [Verrucomicrobiota bacterium]MCH8525742.1 PEP-CTERM sorting domain-containing protein [Kiritimatiellia bacterium]